MATAEMELEKQLKEAGNKLLKPPFSVDQLLPLLDRVESLLLMVDQSPPKSMVDALSPLMKALVEEDLLKHPDVDVRVASASCISEITRITAPEAPYGDDEMKDVFKLIVSSFKDLADQSSRSFRKRASILETVAKVRSCVVMLDLECDGLIIEMFQHFLKAIRDSHSEIIFASMETIMTLVLEESEDVSLELLTAILDSMKKDKEVLPVARKLGENVLEKSAEKIKPYLVKAVKSLDISLDDYSQVVGAICKDSTSDHQLIDGNKLAEESSDVATQDDKIMPTTALPDEAALHVVEETPAEEPPTDEFDPVVDKSLKSAADNGTVEAGKKEESVDKEGSIDQQSDVNLTSKVDSDDKDAIKPVKSEIKPQENSKKRGRKASVIVANSTLSPDSSHVVSKNETEQLSDLPKTSSKDVPKSPSKKDPLVEEVGAPLENKGVSCTPPLPKSPETEATTATSSKESKPKKSGRLNKKPSLILEVTPSKDMSSSTKSNRGMSDLGKKATRGVQKANKIRENINASKVEGETTGDSGSKLLEKSGKEVDASDSKAKAPKQTVSKDLSDSDAKPIRKKSKKSGTGGQEDKPFGHTPKKGATDSEVKAMKKSGDSRIKSNFTVGKASVEKKENGKRRKDKSIPASLTKDEELGSSPKSTVKSAKVEGRAEETPVKNLKRSRGNGLEDVSDVTKFDDSLVGLKVKVWWPKDREFYEGVIESYDADRRKHKVVYTDGDVEILNLKSERWKTIEGDSEPAGDQFTDDRSPGGSSEKHKTKKAKIDAEPVDISSKRLSASSRKKLKSMASGPKPKDEAKADVKSKGDTSKSGTKSEDNSYSKTKDSKSQKGGNKSRADKAAEKSKEVEKLEGKTSSGGDKSNANGPGKGKSVPSKEEGKGQSQETPKTPESAKEKLSDVAKAKESGIKSGMKRKKA